MLQYLSVSKIAQKVAFALDGLLNIVKFHLSMKDTTFLCYTLVKKY